MTVKAVVDENHIRLECKTKSGIDIVIREIRFLDFIALYNIMSRDGFFMPYLNGVKSRTWRYINPYFMPIKYVLLAMISHHLGRFIFGARRHWLMAVEVVGEKKMVGVILLDAVVRFPPGQKTGSETLLESHKVKRDALVGDGEIGFFLDVAHQRKGIVIQSLYALISALSSTRSWCAPEGPILRRVWAETATSNAAARGLLSALGMRVSPEKTISSSESKRYDREGNPLELLHYDQPEDDLERRLPIMAMIDRMENGLVRPGWIVK